MLRAIDSGGVGFWGSRIVRHKEYFCPECGDDVIPKLGEVITWHFAHRLHAGAGCAGSGESAEHRIMKLALAESFREAYEPLGARVEVEHRYSRELRRVSDIAILGATKCHAIEFQRSPITDSLLIERTNDYISSGVPVWWIFTPSVFEGFRHGWVSLSWGMKWLALRSGRFLYYASGGHIMALLFSSWELTRRWDGKHEYQRIDLGTIGDMASNGCHYGIFNGAPVSWAPLDASKAIQYRKMRRAV